MLEILALIWLWRVNGAHAREKGQSVGKYRIITFALWFGLELLGTFAGITISAIFMPDADPFMFAYLLGVLGAFLGGVLSYKVAKNCPQNTNHTQATPSYYSYHTDLQQNTAIESNDLLQAPAAIRIIEQLGGYGAQKDQFYLNGQPICALAPGMGYEFKSNHVKNIITIGTPYCDASDSLHCVRFIASDNGMIEVHAAAGKLIPELFKNYIS